MYIFDMIKLCINAVASAVLMPVENFGYIIFIFIVYSQYKKTVRLQEYVYGQPKTPLKSLVLTSILSGLVAGIVVSIPMTLIGVSFNQDMGIQYLLLISLGMMLIEPRFICFSYSGGILALVSLIFGIKSIDVTGILILVAILHLLEAVLIFIDGHRGAVPVFLERRDGSVTGGFSMQRFWPIPLALVLFAGYGSAAGGGVPTPDWWPMIRPPFIDPGRIGEVLFVLAPITAILGYSEFTSSYLPREKCRNTSYKLVLFSVTLLALAMASSQIYIFKYIAALFAPFGHEALIRWEKWIERNRESIFTPADIGVKVLDTLPGGAAEKMGVQPGEIIMAVNSKEVTGDEWLDNYFKEYINFIWVDIKGRDGKVRTAEYKNYKSGIDGLEILIVSKDTSGLVTLKEQKSYAKRFLGRFFGKKES